MHFDQVHNKQVYIHKVISLLEVNQANLSLVVLQPYRLISFALLLMLSLAFLILSQSDGWFGMWVAGWVVGLVGGVRPG